MNDARVQVALDLLESSRQYLMTLLEGLSDEDWFWTPTGAETRPEAVADSGPRPLEDVPGHATGAAAAYISHIAWQVGHLAMAEYGLLLFRQRGRAEVDLELMPGTFRKRFAKGSQPIGDRAAYPSPSEILEQLNKIHEQVWREAVAFSPEQLDEPLDPPTAAYATKFGAMLMASQHEMLHCGQIGMLRRLMGKPAIR